MCLLQGETKTISCYKVIFIFFAWNKLVLQSWLLGCSPWLTMWTRKSARESFSSDRWKSNITTELIFWEMWSAIFLQTEKIHLPHPAELVMMSHEAGWAKISPLSQKKTSPKNWCWLSKNSTSRRLYIPLLMLFNLYFLFFLLEIPKLSLQQKCKFSQRGPVDWHRELGTLSS